MSERLVGSGRRQSAFFAELERRVEAVYRSEPRLPARRPEHRWVTGYLGDPFSPVWFIAEAPSLGRVEATMAGATWETQWTQSPGDKVFRRMLAKHGFKTGGEYKDSGWRCYLTDVFKSPFRVEDWWKRNANEAKLAVAQAWAPVLRFELEQAKPKLVVVFGAVTGKPLAHLLKRGLIPSLPETVTIYHYAYIGSRAQGKLGPMHDDRVRAWDAEFARIAKRAAALDKR